MPDRCFNEATQSDLASVYPQILGSQWFQLSEAVRRAHLDGQDKICRSGSLRVRQGSSKLARILAWLCGMPANGDAVVTDLSVSAVKGQEAWVRSFGGAIVKSAQYVSKGLVCERFGPIELRFHLKVVDGTLHYEQIDAALRLGSVAIPLPKFLRPRVEAYERSAGANRTHISVVVQVPVVGQLISYDGELEESKTT